MNSVIRYNVLPTPEQPQADIDYTNLYVSGNTTITIPGGNVRVWLLVTAQDGTKGYYWITPNVPPVTVTGITITTQPTKTTYTAGDALNLSGLVVHLSYSNSTSADIALIDFVTNCITTVPAVGDTLTTAEGTVTIAVNGLSV